MKQISFSDAEFAAKKKVTRWERVLRELDASVPWDELVAVIEPLYPAGGGRGRPPIGLVRMLRMYVAQQVLGLSDEGIEDAVCDSQSVRSFVGVDLAVESAPDATLIAAAPSTKNKAKQRDPEMHQSKKGKNYFFCMKAQIGVDAESGLADRQEAKHDHEAPRLQRLSRGPRTGRTHEGFDSSQRGTPHSRGQESDPAPQSALSGIGQEHGSTVQRFPKSFPSAHVLQARARSGKGAAPIG